MAIGNSKGTIDNKEGVALVTVLIFILVISMVALTAMHLTTNQARLIEKQIRRITAFYSSEAAAVQARDELYQNPAATPTSPLAFNGQTINIVYDPASAELNTIIDFSF